MIYSEHVLDRRTGELTELSIRDWMTVTEFGELKGVTARRIRTILREMDFLYVSGGRAHNRHRLTPWVVKAGFGRHIPAKKPKVRFPFDVISPEGREWIEERWSQTLVTLEAQSVRPEVVEAREALAAFQARRSNSLNVQGCVLWLRDHFRNLSHTEMATILDVSQQLVSRYVNLQERQRKRWELAKAKPLPVILKVRTSMRIEEDAWPPVERASLPKPTTRPRVSSASLHGADGGSYWAPALA